jgi:amidase
MRGFSRRLIFCCLFVALLPIGCERADPVVEKESGSLPRLRELDFAPFEKALRSFGKKRFAVIDRLVREGDLDSAGAAMAAGEVTSEELTLYFLNRIRRQDDRLRSMIELNPLALEEARAADRERAAGRGRGPLHGIPVNLKDNIGTGAPMHTTAGAEILLDHSPAANAEVVKKLRAAGAVILGKASLSELAGSLTTDPPGYNAISGMGVNPYREGLPVSGSSSGSAISTSAFLTMGSVGSETSGSLISPGASNGVVAMMPGPGVVSGEGIVPLIRFQDTGGPVGRTVRDVARLLEAMAEGDADYVAALDRGALEGVAVGVLRQAIIADSREDGAEFWLGRIDEGLLNAGASARDLDETFAEKPDLLPILFLGLSVDTVGYLTSAGLPVKSVADLQAYHLADSERRIPRGQNMVDLAVRVLAAISQDTGIAEANLAPLYEEAARGARSAAASILAETFAKNKVEFLVSLANMHSDVYATAGYPAITVPLGLDSTGAPNGVTFIGKPGGEVQLLGFAFAFEEATGYRVPPADRAE